MRRIKTMIPGISGAGYDALYAILELEFLPGGEIWQFYDVPEQVWYEWRQSKEAVVYFHTHIAGRFAARKIF
ncbi:MAG: KTSC domain-containing protein [Lachnospiraceae bacterium]|nr:KTSC domain-containing protein [Lachnospiraceae bacterium]